MARIRIDNTELEITPTRRVGTPGVAGARGGSVRDELYQIEIVIAPDMLAPPLPDGMKADGLLKKEAKDEDIALSMEDPYDDIDEADIITFYCRQPGETQSIKLYEHEFTGYPEDEFPIQFTLTADQHEVEGTYDLYFAAFLAGQGTTYRSIATHLTVDLTPPGQGVELGPLTFDAIDNVDTMGIRAEILRTDPDGGDDYVHARIPSYGGFSGGGVLWAPGDTYTLYESGSAAALGTGEATIVDGQIEVRITEPMLTDIGNKPDASFTYTLTDRAGWESPPSLPKVVRVNMTHIDDLVEAAVPVYDDDPSDNIITLAEARGTDNEGFIVRVPWHAAMNVATDQIVLKMGDEVAGPVSVGPANLPMDILMPYKTSYTAWLKGSGGGITDAPESVDITYLLMRNGVMIGEPQTPHAVDINFFETVPDPDPGTPENEEYRLPVVYSFSDEEDIIPIDDIGKDGRVEIIPATDSDDTTYAILEDDVIKVYYGGTVLAPVTVTTPNDPLDPIVIDLPGSVISAGPTGDVLVWYEVVHELADSSTNVGISLPKTITVEGTEGQPGNGSLPVGVFLEAAGPGTIIGKPKLLDGTDFIIDDYLNRDNDDDIVLTIEWFKEPRHPTTGTEYDSLPKRKTNIPAKATLDPELGKIVIHIPPEAVIGPWDGDTETTMRMHGHAVYTVTKRSGDTIIDMPVTSAPEVVGIDARN